MNLPLQDLPQRPLYFVCIISLGLLIALCLAWEITLAPLREGGSWMSLKALPLAMALPGVIRGRRYTCQWLSMLVLAYFTEGVIRLNDAGLSATLAALEIALSVLLYLALILYARALRNTQPRGTR